MNEIISIDYYKPDYKHSCCNCSNSPVVTGVKDDVVVYQGEMCGPCTWGTSRALYPDTWNEADED